MIPVALPSWDSRHILRASLLAVALLCAAGVRAQNPGDALRLVESMPPGARVPNEEPAGLGYPLPSVMEDLRDDIRPLSLDVAGDSETFLPDYLGKELYTMYPYVPPRSSWVRAEYLAWWMKGADAPPLVTQSLPGTDPPDAGVIGTPGTTVLIGGGPMNADMRSGFRVRMGRWCDCEQTCGAELSFFMLGGGTDASQIDCGDGSDIIGRPWIDPVTGENEAELVCYPDVISGAVTVEANAGNLLGFDGMMRHNICRDPGFSGDVKDLCTTSIRRDFLIGFRYLHYNDGLTIREALTPLSDFVVPGTRIDLEDSFRARNDFYGIKLGLDCRRQRGPWSLEVRPEVSVGVMYRQVRINGATVVSIPGVPTNVMEGGLLALSSNIGEYCSTRAVVMPELDLQVGYLVRPNIRLLAGYSFLFIPNMLRAAEQVDPYVNPELVPPIQPPVTGPQRPAYQERESNVWVQGLTLGAECRF